MKCPFCGTEMLTGYLNCGMTLWSERKHKLSLLPDAREKYALHLQQPLLSPHHVQSCLCPQCKMMLLDASAYEHNLDDAKDSGRH